MANPTGGVALPGTFSASDLRTGKTASGGAGIGIAGTLPQVAGGNTITPGTTAQQAITAETIADAAISVAGDANLVAANIRYGLSVFGVAGSYTANVTLGTAISSSTGVSFSTKGGTLAYNTLTIAVPGGAQKILFVVAYAGWSGGAEANVFLPGGGLLNDATIYGLSTSQANGNGEFLNASPLSLTTSSIYVPVSYSGYTYHYAVAWE